MNSSSSRPALRFVLLLTLGILLAEEFSVQTVSAYVAALLVLVAALGFVMMRRYTILENFLLLICVIVLGLVLHTHNKQTSHARKIVPSSGEEPIVVAGYIDIEPISQSNTYRFGIKSAAFSRDSRMYRLERRFMVLAERERIKQIVDSLEIGRFVAFSGTLQRYPTARNPGEFDYGRYLQLNDINGVVSVRRLDEFKILDAGKSSFQKSVGRIQKVLFKIIDQFHTPEQASFVKGVALGYREDISLEMKQSFVDTGTIHILAVSGSNVAVIALVFYSLFGLLRLPKRVVTSLTIAGLIAYMVITGLSPSVIRATIMAIVILVGLSIERKADIYNSLGVAGAVLLLWDTNYLFDVGFQLSFAAVVSLVYFYPFLAQRIEKIPEWLEEIKGVDSVLKLFAVSLAAQIGTLPFTAYYFGRVSVISLLANLIVVPVSGVNTILGLLIIAFSFISHFVAQMYAALNQWLVTFLLGFVKAASRIPYAFVETAGMNLGFTTLYYALVLFLFNQRRKPVAKLALVLVLAIANVWIFHGVIAHKARVLQVTMLDVGQGDGILLKFPNGKSELLDCGPKSLHFDAGERIVAPFLKRQGIHSLDAITISHPHEDHAGGVSYILQHFRIGRIIESVSSSDSFYVSLQTTAREMGIPVVKMRLGDQMSPDPSVRLYVLHPLPGSDSSSNANNSSLVIKVVYGSTTILFSGDAELGAEEKIGARYAKFIASDVLKVGHHGSETSSSEIFLGNVLPRIALVSVGVNNKFRHPSPQIISRYKQNGVEVYRTDEEGAVIMESDGERWVNVNWRK